MTPMVFIMNELLSIHSVFEFMCSARAAAGEFEVMFTNNEVHKMVRISKTNQDNPNL